MNAEFAGHIMPGQTVRDMDGNVLGKVSHVYREDVNAPSSDQDEYIEVTRGLLGLGKHLYIPVSAVAEATDKEIQLGQVSEYASLSWKYKPDHLKRLN
jgi:hypothetical protein